MKAVALLFALSAMVRSATVQVDANCSGPTVIIDQFSKTCTGNGSSSASGSFVETSSSITINANTRAESGYNKFPGSPIADAGFDLSETIEGDGVPRAGYLSVFGGVTGISQALSGRAEIDVLLNGKIVSFCAPIVCPTSTLIPIELGNPITLEFSDLSIATGDGDGLSTSTEGFTLSVFESDGITPVNAFATVPEPATVAAMGVGLCLLAGLRRNSDGM